MIGKMMMGYWVEGKFLALFSHKPNGRRPNFTESQELAPFRIANATDWEPEDSGTQVPDDWENTLWGLKNDCWSYPSHIPMKNLLQLKCCNLSPFTFFLHAWNAKVEISNDKLFRYLDRLEVQTACLAAIVRAVRAVRPQPNALACLSPGRAGPADGSLGHARHSEVKSCWKKRSQACAVSGIHVRSWHPQFLLAQSFECVSITNHSCFQEVQMESNRSAGGIAALAWTIRANLFEVESNSMASREVCMFDVKHPLRAFRPMKEKDQSKAAEHVL